MFKATQDESPDMYLELPKTQSGSVGDPTIVGRTVRKFILSTPGRIDETAPLAISFKAYPFHTTSTHERALFTINNCPRASGLPTGASCITERLQLLIDTSQKLVLKQMVAGSVTTIITTGVISWLPGVEYRIIVNVDWTADAYSIYVNEVLVGSDATARTAPTWDFPDLIIAGDPNASTSTDGAPNVETFSGVIKAFTIFGTGR
jgi:hypothetical protein